MAERLFITSRSLHLRLERLRKKLGVHKTREILYVLKITPESAMLKLNLTPRGREVFALYLEGMSRAQIAERLGISESGVKRHREKMLWQNDCESIDELVAKYRGTDMPIVQENE